MTREEAIDINWQMEMDIVCGVKPCEDAISLADAKEIIARNDSTNGSIAVFTGKQVQQMLDTLPRIMTKPIECEDAISRHKAIVMITAYEGKSAQIEALEQLPSVQPTRKGYWELLANELYMCSECNAKWTMQLNFCPNCGADMRGDTDADSN